MIIDTDFVNKILVEKSAREISEASGISQRTVEGYQQGKNWLTTNSEALASGVQCFDKTIYIQSINDETKLTEREYLEMILREAIRTWADENEDYRYDYENFREFYNNNWTQNPDYDFKAVYNNGEVADVDWEYSAEALGWLENQIDFFNDVLPKGLEGEE